MNELLSVGGITTALVLLFTLVSQYVPGLRVKWAGVKSEVKKAIVLGLYILFGAVFAFGGCLPFLAKLIPQLLCVEPVGFVQYLFAVAVAVGAGQGVFSLLPELGDVQETKLMREITIFDDEEVI